MTVKRIILSISLFIWGKTVKYLCISGTTIMSLLKDYSNKRHCMLVDNWCISSDLFRFLILNQTNACFTRGIPKIEMELEVEQREVLNDCTIIIFSWFYKRKIIMVTSEYKCEMVIREKLNLKNINN